MDAPSKADAVCAECHAPMGADGRCLSCLLRGGLPEETLVDSSPAHAVPPPATFYGDFEITRRDDGTLWELGRGAMGVTYRAVDRTLHRPVALKVIQFGASPATGSDLSAALRERFLREARAAAALRHANIAGVFHFGAADASGQCYYAMELVEGETLEARVRRDGPLDAGTALEIASQVAAALVAAAGRGLIHRDLKPSNLMLSDVTPPARLEVKVIDFGLAKAAATAGEIDLTHGGFVGTPAFASPEQFERQTVDARTDIYSLGVTLWYTLTGRVPFAGKTLDELRHHPARVVLPVEQLKARKVPPAFVAVLQAMLAEDPAQRPASARELVAALEDCRPPVAARSPLLTGGWKSGRPHAVRVSLGLLLAGVGLAWWIMRPPRQTEASAPVTGGATAPAAPAVPEKSVAVLPFDHFGDDKDGAVFAEGVQDEVLTDLAKLADLKVISRSSALQYRKADARNLREIGKALGVAYVVEGSVQRAGNRIKVTAQLIDARTDAHQWGEQYVRDLSDMFDIQNEIAQAIAGQLQAVISPREHLALTERPTANLEAYAQYVRGKQIVERSLDLVDQRAELLRAVDLLDDATRRDPAFVDAYCFAAHAHDLLYLYGLDATPARRALAETAVDHAVRLRPDAGEVHLARADFYFCCDRDYARAEAELALARPGLPNSAELYLLSASLNRHLGRWVDSTHEFEKARELDPRATNVIDLLVDAYVLTRQFAAAERLYEPSARPDLDPRFSRYVAAAISFAATGNTEKLAAALRELPGYVDPGGGVTPSRIIAALAVGDYPGASAALAASPLAEFQDVDFSFYYPRAWYEAQIARAAGDKARARTAFAACRKVLAERPAAQAGEPRTLAVLAQIDAGLGDKELALAEARRAVELMPISRDAYGGPLVLQGLAQVEVWTGDHAGALDAVETLVRLPGYLTYGYLLKDPMWAPLRGDPRFETLVASLAPGSR